MAKEPQKLLIVACVKFRTEIFRDYNFTGPQIFDFPIDCAQS